MPTPVSIVRIAILSHFSVAREPKEGIILKMDEE